MAVAFRAAAIANSGAGTSTAVLVTKPTGTVDTDGMVANITAAGGTARTITPPSGWVLIGVQNNSAGNTAQWVYYKIASSEPANWTWTLNTAVQWSIDVCSYTGVDQTHPLSFFSQTSDGTTLSTVNFANYNPHSEADFLIACGSYRVSAATRTVTTPSSGFTTRADTTSTTTSPFMGAFMLDGAVTGLPVQLQAVGNTTLSGNRTSCATTVVGLRAAVGSAGVDIDLATVKTAAGTASVVSDTIETVGTNVGVLVTATCDISTAQTVAISTTTGLTFTLVGSINCGVGSGEVWVWRSLAATAVSGTITATGSFGTCNWQLDVHTYRNVNTTNFVGATTSNTTGPGVPASGTIVTTVNNSLVAGGIFINSGTAGTVGTAQSKFASTLFSGNIAENQRKNAVTPTAGTSVTINDTAPNAFNAILVYELLPLVVSSAAIHQTFVRQAINRLASF